MATAATKFIDPFCQWATSMGVPQDAIPSEDALKSAFSARQREVFESLMKRIRPRQEVEAMRQNVLVKEWDKLNGQMVPGSRRVFLPQKLQNLLKVKDLEKKRADIMKRIMDHQEEYEAIAGSYKSKNIQLISAENQNNVLQGKIAILELKSKSLEQDMKKEKENKAHLLLNMPIKLDSQNVSDQHVNDAVQKALNELEAFDDWVTKNNSNSTDLKLAREQLWSKLRKILSNVPNYLLFKCIMRLKELQLEYLIELNKPKISESQTQSLNLTAKESMNDFDKHLMKLKIDALALFVYHKKAIEERQKVEELFCERFSMLANELRDKVVASNPNSESNEHIDEVLSEYLMQHNWHVNLTSGNECLQKQIDQTRNDKSQLAKKLESQELLLGSVKQAYADTNTLVNKIQHEMEQHRSIKMKIIYSVNLLKHKQHEFSTVQTALVNVQPMKMNTLTVTNVAGSGDSFECSGMICEGKFSSTLLNLESPERSFAVGGDTTITAGNETRSNIKLHTLEIKSFVSMSLQNFSHINKECAFLIGHNPLITAKTQNLSSISQLTPGALLTPHAALHEVQQNIALADLVSSQSSNLQFDFELATADVALYNERSKAQYELLNELFDKFDFNEVRMKRSMKKCWIILEFIIANPLRHYISSSIVFNNKTYQEYEAEHNTYMRMVTDCDSFN